MKRQLSTRLEKWIKDSGDKGFEPLEPEHVQYFDDYRRSQKKSLEKKRNNLRQQVQKAVEIKDKEISK